MRLRRSVFDWEKEIWDGFCAVLEGVKIKRNVADSIAWGFCSKGMFSVNSFRRCLEDRREGVLEEEDTVWKGFCPPKVEIFLWQVLRGRVMVKEVLGRFMVNLEGDCSCPLCGNWVETVDHLFLVCEWSWELWMSCMRWWEVQSCVISNIREWFSGWPGLCPVIGLKRVWDTLFYAVVWSIWEARNQVVFKGIAADLLEFQDLVRFRVAWWFKFHGQGSGDSISMIVEKLELCCVEVKKRKKKSVEVWLPPKDEALKFNVDGSYIRDKRKAGIGGVLRNARGEVWCDFAAPVIAVSAAEAELLAIKKACFLCHTVEVLGDREIVIESDSKEVVSWILDDVFGNLALVDVIFDVKEYLRACSNLSLQCISRASNSAADALAKRGAELEGENMSWSVF